MVKISETDAFKTLSRMSEEEFVDAIAFETVLLPEIKAIWFCKLRRLLLGKKRSDMLELSGDGIRGFDSLAAIFPSEKVLVASELLALVPPDLWEKSQVLGYGNLLVFRAVLDEIVEASGAVPLRSAYPRALEKLSRKARRRAADGKMLAEIRARIDLDGEPADWPM